MQWINWFQKITFYGSLIDTLISRSSTIFEYYDCYLCPNNQILKYTTTNRDGYREYNSDSRICENCPYLDRCTHSKNHTKVVTRHGWEGYLEQCEDIRHTVGMKQLYDLRKETIERDFGTAKEHHGMRYTTCPGNAHMRMKVGLTFACMNIKKLVRLLDKKDRRNRSKDLSRQHIFNVLQFITNAGQEKRMLVISW